MKAFFDSNIFLYHLTGNYSLASEYLEKVEMGIIQYTLTALTSILIRRGSLYLIQIHSDTFRSVSSTASIHHMGVSALHRSGSQYRPG